MRFVAGRATYYALGMLALLAPNARKRLLDCGGDAIRALWAWMAVAWKQQIPIQIHEEEWHWRVCEKGICQRRFRPLFEGTRRTVTWNHEQR